jgi:hypothetical protein
MKWIKSRKLFTNEAKIRDLVLPRQATEIAAKWGERYLDYEETTPTTKINQGKWKLDEEDKNKLLGAFFNADMNQLLRILGDLPDKFADILSKSIDTNLLGDKYKEIFKEFNPKKPSVDQIICLYDNIFRKLSVGETKASEVISRDETGKPLKDEANQIIKVKKEAGDPIFSKNIVNLSTFINEYNLCFPEEKVSDAVLRSNDIQQIINISKQTFEPDYVVGYEIFGKDIYLSILHNPKDILNITITKFYSSCQHLYTGQYRQHVLSGVFDPNTIPAYFVVETPITWQGDVISEVLPLTRLLVRSIEGYDDKEEDKKLFFDLTYPDRCKRVAWELIEKYSNNIPLNGKLDRYNTNYNWFANVDPSDELILPYMDTLSVNKQKYIGSNIKNIRLDDQDWSKVKIAPNANVESIIIETNSLPKNFFELKLNPKWIKFKFLKLNDFTPFKNLNSTSIGFDKCSMDPSILKDINFENLLLSGCDLTGNLNLEKNLNDLKIIYSLDSKTKLEDFIGSTKFKSLEISSDLVSENKEYLKNLKKNNIEVKIVGPNL